MHDRTRRLLCRTAFVLLCIVPTLIVVTGICVVRSPAYVAARKAAWQQRLSARLGLSVSVTAVSTAPRGVVLLEGVAIDDPETHARIADIRRIEMGYNGDQYIVLAAQPEVQGPHLWRLWEVLHERILRSHDAATLQAQLYAAEVTVHRGDRRTASTLTDVRCRLAPTSAGPQASIEFRDVALQMAEPALLRVTRNRQATPPATRWELHTRSTALPCSLLADQVEILAGLGERATFQGTAEGMPAADGWQGEINGRFRDVDLDRLVTERYDHKLSGSAEIVFRRAAFRDGKLIDAAGDVFSSGGVVSWSLLQQADRSLGLVADARVRGIEADALWRYRELKLGFTLSEEGLKIVGLCHSVGEGVVMADHYGPLLTDKPQEIQQVAALVRTLASGHGEQVPATSEAYQLLHVLPIPSRRESQRLNATRPLYSPLRLKR